MTRIILADDRTLLREGLRRILSAAEDLEIVAETTTGPDLLDRVRTIDADTAIVVVTDDWPRIIAATAALRSHGLNVLIVATDPASDDIRHAARAGAAGTITTACTADELIDAVRCAASGRAIGRQRRAPSEDARPLPVLSDREFEVMRMLAGGRSVNEIAGLLGLSPKTVGTYRGRVMDKLSLNGTADLVRFALERGLAG